MFTILRLETLPLFSEYFVRANSPRRPLDVLLPTLNSEQSRKSFHYWGAKLWNSIPLAIRQANTLTQFLSQYELYLKPHVTTTDLESYDLYDFI